MKDERDRKHVTHDVKAGKCHPPTCADCLHERRRGEANGVKRPRHRWFRFPLMHFVLDLPEIRCPGCAWYLERGHEPVLYVLDGR